MPPKRPAAPSGSTPKRARRVLTLNEKNEVLKQLDSGMSYAAVGRHFGLNESSVRGIKRRAKDLKHALASSAPVTSKVTSHVRDDALIKMEKALNIWIEDLNRRRIPLDSKFIRQKAKELYDRFSKSDDHGVGDGDGDNLKKFAASKGWFEKFRHRYGLHNIKVTGEAASADTVAGEAYPAEFANHIEQKGYRPEQVFNADESGLWWKKMPRRTYISKEEKSAPGFKVAKDRVTVMLCGNAAGHMIKPMLLYTAARPRALKNKNMNLLPVFYRNNKKAWMTSDLCVDWLKNCFAREVKDYLDELGMEFNVVLYLDNCPGHSEELKTAHPNIEVVFLPKNTTSIIQPMDQGVIVVFKAKYAEKTFSMIRECLDKDADVTPREMWKKFDIAQCINFIAESHNELSQNCVRSCWKKLWPEIVPTFTGFPTAEPQLRNIITMANEVGGEGFSDLTAAEVQEELLGNVGDPFTSDELEQLVELQDETEDEVSDDENKNLTLDNLGEVIRMSKALSARLYDIDPSLDRSLKAKRAIENVMLPYIELQREMRSKKAQTTITNFFSRRVPAIAEPAGILQQEAEAADTSQQQDVEAAGTSQQQDAVPAHTPQEDADLDSSYSSDWSGF